MFEDFFSIYEMVEPPKLENAEVSNFEEIFNSPEYFDKTDYFYNLKDPLENPFNNLKFDNYKFDNLKIDNLKIDGLLNLDIEDLLKQENITSINGKAIKFGDKNLRTWGKTTSHHRRKDARTGYASARDISIVGGTTKDYEDFKKILLNNENVREWMRLKDWGIINEITPSILSQTGGTGNHFHFGPDKWARNTWQAWINNPDVTVTKSFKNYKQQFAKDLNKTYRKVLLERGLNPNYSLMLTALDGNESGWGSSTIGRYNYGNIMATDDNYTIDRRGRKWLNFSSMEDYVNHKIDTLLKERYKFFQTFNPDSNVSIAMQTLANRGYDPGNPNYGKNISNTYKTLIKWLS